MLSHIQVKSRIAGNDVSIRKVQQWGINDERRLTDPHRPYQVIWSPQPSPVVLLLGRHNSVSPCGPRGPCPNPALLKCPRTGWSKNCRPVRSSLLGSLPVGPPGPPDRFEHQFCLTIICSIGLDHRVRRSCSAIIEYPRASWVMPDHSANLSD